MTGDGASAEAGLILLVEPDARLRDEVAGFLGRHGFAVRATDEAAAAEAVLQQEPVDVVILGADRLEAEALAFCRRIAETARARIIIVSAAASEIDRVLGLEFGADDFLAKPFSPRELLARIRAIRRRQAGGRAAAPAAPVYAFDVFVLDTARRELRAEGGQTIVLPAGVMELLQVFVEHPKRVLSREDLVATAGLDPGIDPRAVDMRVSRVRQTLRALGERDIIRTVRGSGYVLDAEVAPWRGSPG